MARVFVAFPLSEDARAEVARVARTLASPDLRVVPPENLHLTIAFLGDRADVAAVKDALVPTAGDTLPIAVRLDRVGGFPSDRRARTVFVGVADPSGDLARAAGALREALGRAPTCWEPDRGFVPHITVARARAGAVRVPPLAVEPLAFQIEAVQVVGSSLRPGRPPSYEVLAELRSTGSAASA